MSDSFYKVSYVTCHKSPKPTATGPDPPPAYAPIMHSRLDRLEFLLSFGTSQIIQKKKLIVQSFLAICSLTRSLQSTWLWVPQKETTTNTRTESA